MTSTRLAGVIAAVPTPLVPKTREPDTARFVAICQKLLADGCDALNLCGTTGEAASFSLAQRISLMKAAAAKLPLDRLMVGTGAAATADAITLTKQAADLGFGAALVLPPFYYKNVPDQGIVDYFGALVDAVSASPLPLYLYNIPAMTGVTFHRELVSTLIAKFGGKIRGLKDSSGNIEYSRAIAALSKEFDVFPSDEGSLLEAKAGTFAGCISASANVNSRYCAAAWKTGDVASLDKARRIRAIVSKRNLIVSVKAVVAAIHGDRTMEVPMPPLVELSEAERSALLDEYWSVAERSH